MHRLPLALALAGLLGCDATSLPVEGSGTDAGASEDDGATTNACALLDHTTSTGSGHADCDVLERDTSACAADRAAQGLTGFWQRFSCRVTLSKVTVNG